VDHELDLLAAELLEVAVPPAAEEPLDECVGSLTHALLGRHHLSDVRAVRLRLELELALCRADVRGEHIAAHVKRLLDVPLLVARDQDALTAREAGPDPHHRYAVDAAGAAYWLLVQIVVHGECCHRGRGG
jgi:hypothetical protein